MKGSTGTSTVTHKIPNWNKKTVTTNESVIIKLGSPRQCSLCGKTIMTGLKARLVGEARLPEHLRCKE